MRHDGECEYTCTMGQLQQQTNATIEKEKLCLAEQKWLSNHSYCHHCGYIHIPSLWPVLQWHAACMK